MEKKSSESTIHLNSKQIIRRVFIFLLIFELVIVFGDVFLNELEWVSSRSLRRFFNITREDSLANWFSSMQALLVAFVVLGIAFLTRLKKAKKMDSAGWFILAFLFAFISMDDGSKFHERVGTTFTNWMETTGFDALPTYGWQIILGPVFAVIGIYALWFLWSRFIKKERMLFILAIVLMGLAVGLDFVEGTDYPIMDEHSVEHILKVIEEFFEMFATTILLVVFLKILFRQKKRLSFELD